MNFDKKVVLVTGGARGIGAAITSAFAERGATIALTYNQNQAKAEKHLKNLNGAGHICLRADVKILQECQDLLKGVIDHFGRIDILVNNAGIFTYHAVDEVTLEEWDRIFHETFEVNLFGPARLMYLVSQEMMKTGGGRIVNISSRGAFRGEPDQPAYGASKAALNALGQSLAQKLAPNRIFIGTVAPGFVETDMAKQVLEGPDGDDIRTQSPLNRVAKPEEVAYAVLFLAAEGSEFSTGSIIDVNGASYLR